MRFSVWIVCIVGVFLGWVLWDNGAAVDTDIDISIFEYPSGKVVNLTHGSVHYRWYGPEDGEMVVVVHGLADSGLMMQWLATDLANAGFHVLVFDLYGRGHSSSVLVDHTHHLFIQQLNELLVKLDKHNSTFHLVGHSMGGAIASVYAAEHPEKVLKLILLSPAGIPFDIPLVGRLSQIPYLGEILAGSWMGKMIVMHRAHSVFMAPHLCPHQYKFTKALTYYHAYRKEGFFNAVLSSLRHFPLSNCVDYFRKIGEQTKIPVLLVWGTADQTTPYSGSEKILRLIPQAEFVSIPYGTHVMFLENSTYIHPKIVNFLS